jgi:hypothetical protein
MRPRVQTILARIDALKSNHPQLEAAERTQLLRGQARLAENEAWCRAWELSRADDAKDDAKWRARYRRNDRIQRGLMAIVEICMITEGVALFMLGLAIHP